MSSTTPPATANPPEPSSRTFRASWVLRALLWLCLSVALLLIGLVLVVQAIILPRIDTFRPYLAEMATKAVGQPVQIGQLRVTDDSWIQPTVAADNLVIQDDEGAAGLQVDRIEATLSLQGLLRLGIERMHAYAPALEAQRLADGTIHVAGMALKQGKQSDSGPAMNWLLSQPHLQIHDGRIRWRDATRSEAPLELTAVQATLTNAGLDHNLQVSTAPPAGWGEAISFVSEWQHPLLADRTEWQKWNGVAYLDLPHLDMSQLRRYVELGHKIDLRQGRGSLQIWADFKQMQRTAMHVVAKLDEVNLRLSPKLPPFGLKNLDSQFSMTLNDPGEPHAQFHFVSQKLDFTTLDGQRWPSGNIDITLDNGTDRPESQGVLKGSRWDLGMIRTLATSLPLGESTLHALQAYQPQGQLDQLEVHWQGPLDQPSITTAEGSASQLAWRAQRGGWNDQSGHENPGIPGVQGAAIHFSMQDNHGKATIKMHNGGIDLPGVFDDEHLPLERLTTDLTWQYDKQGFIKVQAPNIHLSNQDLQGSAGVVWQNYPLGSTASGQPNTPGWLDVQATLQQALPQRVYRYLPKALSKTARDYVRLSILGGTIRNATIRVRGHLNHIPDPQPGGIFRFDVPLHQAHYRFLPKELQHAGDLPWPDLTHLDGKLIIDGLALSVVGASARFSTAPDLQAHHLSAHIPDLASPNFAVGIDTQATGPLQQALDLTRLSPLGGIAHHALDQATGTGQTDLQLTLGLPIHHIKNAIVQGNVVLKGNHVRITPNTPLLANSTGQVSFSEQGFNLQDVKTHMLGGSAVLAGGLQPAKQGKPSKVQFTAQGTFSDIGLRDEPTVSVLKPLAEYMEGSSSYQARLGFDHGVPELTIDSDLRGMALHFPAPLQIAAETPLPLHIENTVVRNTTNPTTGKTIPVEDQLIMRLGDLALAHYIRDVSQADNPRVLRGTLALGEEAINNLPPMPEHDVQGVMLLDNLDADAWQQVGEKLAASHISSHNTQAAEAQSRYLPTIFAAHVTKLTWLQRKWDELVIGTTREDRLWRISLNAKQANGNVELLQAPDGGISSVRARLASLTIEPITIDRVKRLVSDTQDPDTLPAIDLDARKLDLLGYQFDRITLLAGSNRNRIADAPLSDGDKDDSSGWRIQSLEVHAPHGHLEGSGIWGIPSSNTTAAPDASPARRFVALHVRVDSDNVGNLLQHFGIKDQVAGGAGIVTGNVRWLGSPIAPELASMAGEVRTDLRNGRIIKIDPGAARLLNLFSLQALARAGSVQAGKGFGFEQIYGTLQLNNSILRTEDTHITGTTIADVQLKGSASLRDHQVNAHALVRPKLDFSNAALATAVINPLLGVGSYIAQWVLSSTINSANTKVMHITGDWKAPQVNTLKGDTAKEVMADMAKTPTATSTDRLWNWHPIFGAPAAAQR